MCWKSCNYIGSISIVTTIEQDLIMNSILCQAGFKMVKIRLVQIKINVSLMKRKQD